MYVYICDIEDWDFEKILTSVQKIYLKNKKYQ